MFSLVSRKFLAMRNIALYSVLVHWCQQPKLDLFNTEKIALQTNYLIFCEKTKEKTGFIYEQNKIDKPGNIKA